LMAIDDRQLSARKWHKIHTFSRRNFHIGNKLYFKYSLYFRRLNTKNMSSFTRQSNIIMWISTEKHWRHWLRKEEYENKWHSSNGCVSKFLSLNIISYDYFYWIYDKFWSEAVSSQMELW
jgi:hypothetical protein